MLCAPLPGPIGFMDRAVEEFLFIGAGLELSLELAFSSMWKALSQLLKGGVVMGEARPDTRATIRVAESEP